MAGRIRLLQRPQGLQHVRLEAGAAGIEMREDGLAHPGIPELLDVLGDARHGLVMALALEKLADLVRHIDQPVFVAMRRHRWCLRQLIGSRRSESVADG